jgi:hypothetical protein
MANVKDYGAKGDGVTDDTVAIQAAIDAVQAKSRRPCRWWCRCQSDGEGRTLNFPMGGTYKITNTLDFSGWNEWYSPYSVDFGGATITATEQLGNKPAMKSKRPGCCGSGTGASQQKDDVWK